MSFQAFYDRTSPILYTCQLFGICGNVSVTEESRWNKIKKYFLITYSIFLIVFNTFNHYITPSTKYSGHNGSVLSDVLKSGFWISKSIVCIVIPMSLFGHEKFKSTVENVCKDAEIDVNDVNFNWAKYFYYFLLVVWLFDGIAWTILNTGGTVWERLLSYILIKYMDHVVSLCYLKFSLIVILLTEVLRRFNENLKSLEPYLNNTYKKNQKFEMELKRVKQQLLVVMENTREVSDIVGPSFVVMLLSGLMLVCVLMFPVVLLLLDGYSVLLHTIAITMFILNFLSSLFSINCCNLLVKEVSQYDIME